MTTPIMIIINSSQACIFPMRLNIGCAKTSPFYANVFLSDKGKDRLKKVPFFEGKEKHQNKLWHQSCTETPDTNGKEMPASKTDSDCGELCLKKREGEGGCGAWWAQRNQLARAVRRWLTGRTRKPAFVPAPLRSPTEPAQRHTRIQRIQRCRE